MDEITSLYATVKAQYFSLPPVIRAGVWFVAGVVFAVVLL